MQISSWAKGAAAPTRKHVVGGRGHAGRVVDRWRQKSGTQAVPAGAFVIQAGCGIKGHTLVEIVYPDGHQDAGGLATAALGICGPTAAAPRHRPRSKLRSCWAQRYHNASAIGPFHLSSTAKIIVRTRAGRFIPRFPSRGQRIILPTGCPQTRTALHSGRPARHGPSLWPPPAQRPPNPRSAHPLPRIAIPPRPALWPRRAMRPTER